MQVILLERVENLGQMGDVVAVKPGYARNFLLPRQKALRATQENIVYFEGQKKAIAAESLKKKAEAEKVAKKIGGLKVAIIRQASEAGQLYGSVTARDIAIAIIDAGFKVDRTQVSLGQNYKLLGLYPIKVWLHPEVPVEVTINIARSEEEAKIQEERGEALIVKSDHEEAADLAAAAIRKVDAEEAAAKAAAEAAEAEAPAED
ncbi:MAG: 50S ribosomal protein L9 [Alphaproteobacteria bacterium]|nr:50S ribosomal protein L9 [Alphaproteobacteria bacterium]